MVCQDGMKSIINRYVHEIFVMGGTVKDWGVVEWFKHLFRDDFE